MKRLIKLAADHPWPILIVLAVLTVLAATQLHRLHFHISLESLLDKGSPAWDYFASTEETFGDEDVSVVVLSDPELFKPEILAAIREAVRALDTLPYVSRTSSLFDAPNLKNVDGFIHTRPYLDPFPETDAEVARLKADAIRNPLLLGNLISADGQTIAINVFFDRRLGDPAFDRMATETVEAIIAPLRARVAAVYQIGIVAIRSDLTNKVRTDQVLILPLSVLVLLLTLAVTLRRVTAALIPLCTAGLSVVWTLGAMAALEIPVNVMTSIVPALVIIIGSTEDIHLLAEYAVGRRAGYSRQAAIARMADKMGMAVLLTFITTYLGFLSIALNDIELLYQFGLVASTGLLFNFVITVLLVPVMLNGFGHRGAPVAPVVASDTWYQRWAVRLLLHIRRRPRLVFIIAAVLAVAALLAASQLRINNNLLDYLEDGSPLRANAERIHMDLSGIQSFSIVVESGIENTFLQTRYLQELQKIQGFLTDTGTFDRSFSFADFVALVNSVMEDDDGSALRLPESDEIVREYMLFIPYRDVNGYVSPQYDRARILVRHNIGSSHELNREVAALREFVDSAIDPALRVEITGKSVLSSQAVEQMAESQLHSLLLVGAVIVCLVSLLFVSVRAGVIALLPTLFPVVTLFGVMAVLGVPLNVGTGMVAAIALGICVDDNMHVMSRFHEELKLHDNRGDALVAMVRAETVPIFATSIALVAGFAVFATSSFQPVVHFGLLSAMVIAVALLATFILTPLLLGTAELLTVWDLLSYRVQKRALRTSPLFRGMHIWQIKKLLLASEIRSFDAGSQIIEEGREGSQMFVVLQGAVEARKRHTDGTIDHLRVMRVGELFGEVAPLSGSRRTADVVALQDTEVLVLSWARLDRLTSRYPLLAFRLFRNFSKIMAARLLQTSEYQIEAGGDQTSSVGSGDPTGEAP